jgi:hypothetical protein
MLITAFALLLFFIVCFVLTVLRSLDYYLIPRPVRLLIVAEALAVIVTWLWVLIEGVNYV